MAPRTTHKQLRRGDRRKEGQNEGGLVSEIQGVKQVVSGGKPHRGGASG
jgi:hypothetical protein